MNGETIVDYTIICPAEVDLQWMLTKCNDYVSTLLHGYIWQKESFELYISSDVECSLGGSTNVGENINDEWFIVFLLLQLSKLYNDVVIRVTDSDGCFILIEAAEHLPKWVKPDNSENRFFIHNGTTHLIPYPSTPAEVTLYPGGIPTLQQAYDVICDENIRTEASDDIQQCICERIKDYPTKIHKDFHHAHCFLPEEVVYILQKKPAWVASAVQAFYNRDHLDVKSCKKLSSFDADHQACATVRFTRHLYCQLQQANFHPDRKTKWALPPLSDKQYKAREIGYKLACGFEILISRYKSSKNDGEPYGKKWQQYLENLQKNDFFQNELEGSKKYKELTKEAKRHFKQHVRESTDEFGEELLQLLDEASNHRIDIQESCKVLQDKDSDDWMTVSPEELDSMMIGRWGKQRPTNNSDGPQHDETQELDRLVDNMKLFVTKVSSYEGVEVPNDGDKTDDDKNKGGRNNGDRNNGVKNKEDHNDGQQNEGIDFDPTMFMESIKNILSPQPAKSKPKETFDSGNDSEAECSDDEVDDDFISCDPSHEAEEDGFHDVIYKMEDELRGTSIPRSFKDSRTDVDEESDEFDYDVNLIKNFLESFSSQDGLSGPVSNIIQSMGLSLPPNMEDG